MIHVNFDNFPVLESEILVMRRLFPADITEIIALRGNADTMQYIPRNLCTTAADAQELIDKFDEMINKNEGINLAMANKIDNKLIGLISFHRIEKENHRAELGYMILPEFRGKGLISQGVQTVLEFGFETLGFHSVFAIVNAKNEASERVLQRNHFKKEAHFIENMCYNGKFVDTVFYSILKRNFVKKDN